MKNKNTQLTIPGIFLGNSDQRQDDNKNETAVKVISFEQIIIKKELEIEAKKINDYLQRFKYCLKLE